MNSILSVFLKESNYLTFLSQRLPHQKALVVWTEIFFVKATKTRNAYQETWKSMECWRSRVVAMATVPAIFHLLLQIYLWVPLPILWPGRPTCKATLAGPFAHWLTVGFSEWGCPMVIKTKEGLYCLASSGALSLNEHIQLTKIKLCLMFTFCIRFSSY